MYALGRRWARLKREGAHPMRLRFIENAMEYAEMGTDDPLGDWHGKNT